MPQGNSGRTDVARACGVPRPGRIVPVPRDGGHVTITRGNAMLYLTRKVGESVVINDDIEITVVEVRGRSIKLGFTFPPEVSVLRREIYERIQAENQAAAAPGALPQGFQELLRARPRSDDDKSSDESEPSVSQPSGSQPSGSRSPGPHVERRPSRKT